MFCFPRTQTALALYTRKAIIYLQGYACLFLSSIPLEKCPYHSLGFSLAGFTSFHLHNFLYSSVTVAPSGYFGHIRRLRRSTRRQLQSSCLSLLFRQARSLRPSQVRASMDFPLRPEAGAIARIPMATLVYCISLQKTKGFTRCSAYCRKRGSPNGTTCEEYQN